MKETATVSEKPAQRVSKGALANAVDHFPRLGDKVLFWLADMTSFSTKKDARARLGNLSDDEGVPSLFSPSYFTTEEALCLARLPLGKSGSNNTLGEAFGRFLAEREQKSKGREVCFSSEIAPFLRYRLRFPSDFQTDGTFKRGYVTFQRQWRARN